MQSIRQGAGEPRSASIDIFRGLLVLAVILGHFLEITQRHSFFAWLGLGIRMPLFIGLTGYLFNLEQARSMPVTALWRKYYGRLILPWAVACAIHLTLTEQFHWFTPFYAVVRPPYHLWFVPVLLLFIFLSRTNRLDPPAMLAVVIPTSIAAMYLFGVGHVIEQYRDWVPDRRYFIYPIYFVFGLWVARSSFEAWKKYASLLVGLIGLLWWCRLYQEIAPAAEVAAMLLMSMPLIGLLPWVRGLSLNMATLAAIGRDSLFLYLWHPFVFGLVVASGVSGRPMLELSLLLLFAARAAIARMPRLRVILGVEPPRPPADAPAAFLLDTSAPRQAR